MSDGGAKLAASSWADAPIAAAAPPTSERASPGAVPRRFRLGSVAPGLVVTDVVAAVVEVSLVFAPVQLLFAPRLGCGRC